MDAFVGMVFGAFRIWAGWGSRLVYSGARPGPIEPGLARAAFQPFFMTKAEGKGSGLGLSMVLGVAQQSGGDVRVRSRAGDGTSIEVYLPRAQNMASSDGLAVAGPATIVVDEDLRE